MTARIKHPPDTKGTAIAVIGGGRWARVIVSVLAEMNLPFENLVVVTKANAQLMAHFIGTQCSKTLIPINTVSSLDELLLSYHVKAAIVVNSAHQHFATSMRLIDHRINILIEKPIVLTSKNAHELLNKVEGTGVCLVPGLQYRFCSYIQHFAHLISLSKKKPRSFFIKWSDKADEARYGETKTYDHSIDIAQDVMPHIWTLLSEIFPQELISFKSCRSDLQGCFVDFSVAIGELQGCITLERNATQRQRIISVQFDSNEILSINFSQEPGIIDLNGKSISGDPHWDTNPRPLARQFSYFLTTMEKGCIFKTDANACLDSVSFSEHASTLMYKNLLQL